MQALGVAQYESAFANCGTKNLEDTLLLSEDEWKSMGVKNFHRKKILNEALKQSGKHWLDVCSLPQYKEAFEEMGVDSCADAMMLEDDDWKELKVKAFHKKKILNFAKLWSGEGDEGGADEIKEKEDQEKKEKEEKEKKEKEEKDKKEKEKKEQEKKEQEEKEKKEKEEKERKEREEKEKKEKEDASTASKEDDDSLGTSSDKSEKTKPQPTTTKPLTPKGQPPPQGKKPTQQQTQAAAGATPSSPQVGAAGGTSGPSLALASKQAAPQMERMQKRLSVQQNVAVTTDQYIKDMYIAAKDKDKEGVMKILHLCGPSIINSQDNSGRLLLNSLLIGKDTDIKDFIAFLLEIGASITSKDKNWWTPIHAASYGGSTEILMFLLENGGESKPTTITETLAAHYFCFRNLEGEDKSVCIDILHRLFRDVDVNHINARGESVLHYACMGAATPFVIDLLLSYGADCEKLNPKSQTPAEIARVRGHFEVAEMIAAHQEKLAKKGEEDASPLKKLYDEINQWGAMPAKELVDLAAKYTPPSEDGKGFTPPTSLDFSAHEYLAFPAWNKQIFAELKDNDAPGSGITKTQALGLMVANSPLVLSMLGVEALGPNMNPQKTIFLASKQDFLGALYIPIWQEVAILALLQIHSKYITTEELFDLLMKDRAQLGHLNRVLRLWIRDWNMSALKQTKRFLKPLFTSVRNSEKKGKLTTVEKALKDEIAKAHSSRHKAKEHLKCMNEFVCFSAQAADSFDGMDDTLFVQQITQGEYLLHKRLSDDVILCHRQKPVPVQNILFHSSAFRRWVSYCVLEGETSNDQVATIARFVNIATKCVEAGNFASAKHILDGLDQAHSSRIASAWKLLPAEISGVLKKLRDLFKKEDGSYKAYHKAVMERKKSGALLISCYDVLMEDMRPSLVGVCLDIPHCKKIRIWDAVKCWLLLDIFGFKDQETSHEESAFMKQDNQSSSYLAFIWSSSDHLTPAQLISRSLALCPPAEEEK